VERRITGGRKALSPVSERDVEGKEGARRSHSPVVLDETASVAAKAAQTASTILLHMAVVALYKGEREGKHTLRVYYDSISPRGFSAAARVMAASRGGRAHIRLHYLPPALCRQAEAGRGGWRRPL